jgi:hypothetical protein
VTSLPVDAPRCIGGLAAGAIVGWKILIAPAIAGAARNRKRLDRFNSETMTITLLRFFGGPTDFCVNGRLPKACANSRLTVYDALVLRRRYLRRPFFEASAPSLRRYLRPKVSLNEPPYRFVAKIMKANARRPEFRFDRYQVASVGAALRT